MRRAFALICLLLASMPLAYVQAQVSRPATGGTFSRQRATVSADTSRNLMGMPQSQEKERDTTESMPSGIDFSHHDIPDTTLQRQVFMFNHQPLAVGISSISYPSLDPTGAEFIDPIDRVLSGFYFSRGNIGQQHYSITTLHQPPLAFNFRPQLFPALLKTPYNIAFCQTQRPYTTLHYGSSLNKDYRFGITHSQNITPRWNVAMNYNLVSLDGVYTNGNVDNHQLDISTNYYSADSRYQLRAAFIRQQFTTSENGGIANDAQFTDRLQNNRAGVMVNLYSAASRQRELTMFVHQSYNFVMQVPATRQRDSLVIKDTVTADSLKTPTTKVDTIVLTDTIWPAAPRTFNAGVVAFDIQYDRSRRNYNDISVDTSKIYYSLCRFSNTQTFDSSCQHTVGATLYWTNRAYPAYRFVPPVTLTAGVKPQVSKIIQSTTTNIFASAAPFAQLVLQLPADLSVEASMLTTLSDNYLAGNTDISAAIHKPVNVGKRRLSASLSASHTIASPDYIYYHYDANNYVWDNQLRKSVNTAVQLAVADNTLGSLKLSAMRMGNVVAFDSQMRVRQHAAPAMVLKADAVMRFSRGRFHCDMHHLLQYTDNAEVVRLPFFATKNSFYADLRLFHHALRAQTGIDLRYHTRFYADAYNPVVGAFYQQDEVQIGNYLWVDAFVSIQVKRATIYLKALHLNAPIDPSPHYFALPHCPGRDLSVYWGIEWKFFD